MHRQPRRLNPHPRYQRGTRLRADEVRRARQQRLQAEAPGDQGEAVQIDAPAPSPTRPPAPIDARDHRLRPVDRQPAVKSQSPPRRWSPWKVGGLVALVVAFIGIGAFVVPILLEAREAADKIFVTPSARVRVVTNAEGTPELVPEQGGEIPTWNGTKRINVLLLGIDDRRDGEAARSDTMIIVSIDPTTKEVGMLSIPRDLLVTIPGYGEDKINAAYPAGDSSGVSGPELVRATVEYNFDISIDYYAEVDFQGFEKIVDTLGGVTVDVPAPIKDDEYPGEQSNYTRVYFHTGVQHMNGIDALRYARTRHDDNDFARGARQQQILMALREQGINLGLITKAPELMADLGDTVRTDIPPGSVLPLANLALGMNRDNIQSYNLLSAVQEQWAPGLPYYLIPDWSAVHTILDEMMGGAASSGADATATESEPDHAAVVLVQNATRVDRLASSAASRLMAAGYTDVTPAQSPDTGGYPTSQIIDYSDNPATARDIAETLGLPESAIVEGDPGAAGGNDVVVILGDDAPTPGT